VQKGRNSRGALSEQSALGSRLNHAHHLMIAAMMTVALKFLASLS
jgi:hypothetical protein